MYRALAAVAAIDASSNLHGALEPRFVDCAQPGAERHFERLRFRAPIDIRALLVKRDVAVETGARQPVLFVAACRRGASRGDRSRGGSPCSGGNVELHAFVRA